MVKDLKDRIFMQTLNVETRKDQVNLRSVICRKFKEENDSESSVESENEGRTWEAPSVFENWKQDSSNSIQRAYEIDSRFYMLKRNLKGTSAAQLNKVKAVIMSNYQTIKNVFIDLAASSTEYPGVCREKVVNLVLGWDEPCLNTTTINAIFDKANDQTTGLTPPGQSLTGKEVSEHRNNSRSQLRRFEFTDLLVLASKVVEKKDKDKKGTYESDLDLEVDE